MNRLSDTIEFDASAGTLRCQRCGRTRDLPLDVMQVEAFAAGFERRHSACAHIASIWSEQEEKFGELADRSIHAAVQTALSHVDP